MQLFRCLASPVGVGLAFFAITAPTVHFSRFSGGFAMVWFASALMAGRLVVTAERNWMPHVVACAIASTLATGFFGLGWAAAVPMAIVNVAEASAAALVMRRISIAFWPHDTLEWIAGYYIGIGLVIPLTSGALATIVATLVRSGDPMVNFTHWIIGHSLGLLACLPIFRFFYWRTSRGRSFLPRSANQESIFIILAVYSVLCAMVFLMEMRALLVFPLLFIVVGAAVLEEATIAALPVLLIAIGGAMTVLDMGPIARMDVSYGDRIQFFQLYVGVTVLAGLPVSCERSRRMAELRRMRERVARLERGEPTHA